MKLLETKTTFYKKTKKIRIEHFSESGKSLYDLSYQWVKKIGFSCFTVIFFKRIE